MGVSYPSWGERKEPAPATYKVFERLKHIPEPPLIPPWQAIRCWRVFLKQIMHLKGTAHTSRKGDWADSGPELVR